MTTPCGYQQITVLTTSTALTVPTTNQQQPTYCVLRAEAQAVRWRDDGVAPTATIGMPLAVADAPYIYRGAVSNLRVIEQVAGGILNVTYYYG